MDLAMYILVNKDVEIVKQDGTGAGKLGGQIGHAVSSFDYHKFIKNGGNATIEERKQYENYMEGTQKKILVRCSQRKLEELEKQGYITIRDRGLTMLEPNTLTCVNAGIFDRDRDEVPKWIKKLQLYK